uniref:hypothetical protein n=1 Tax=Actinoplanes sp. CA-151224 TaxID=3239904 RepID=UPI003F494B54
MTVLIVIGPGSLRLLHTWVRAYMARRTLTAVLDGLPASVSEVKVHISDPGGSRLDVQGVTDPVPGS